MLTQETLKSFFHYCQETGVFTRLIRTSSNARVGDVAGSVGSHGYMEIMVDRKRYSAHRLAWLYVHGEFPPNDIDHINRIKTDNRLCNLRLATTAENSQNRSISTRNTSGHVGLCWSKRNKKWQAEIMINYKKIYLGVFSDLSEAIAARKAAELQYHQFQHQ